MFFALAGTSWAQLSEAERWVAQVGNAYEVEPNVTYVVANNYEAKLDVYYPPGAKAAVPVVMAIHGGGWIEGTKEKSILNVLPYLQMGFAVVNVEYRLAKVSLAPAAVEDCLCASSLDWKKCAEVPLRSQQGDSDWRIGRGTLSADHSHDSILCGIRK